MSNRRHNKMLSTLTNFFSQSARCFEVEGFEFPRKITQMDLDFDPTKDRLLSNGEEELLNAQNSRLVSNFAAHKLELDAKKYWDLFYKRNETRFFKDRHWTTREFHELLETSDCDEKNLLEIGCGVGNFIFPLLQEQKNFFIYACDISPRAIELLKSNPLYNDKTVLAFQSDITTKDIFDRIKSESINIVTLIFVLSAIHPDKFSDCVVNIYNLLKPGGVVLFRDYALHDMAQIRFKPGHKIAENFYMRQDGTRSYYFSRDKLTEIFTSCGFDTIVNGYIQRRTVNKKEGIDAIRLFLQAKFRKPNGKQECPKTE